MNNKGFTLIELLGVLVVLSIIVLIAIPTINSSLKKNRERDKEHTEGSIISSVEIYVSNHKVDIDYTNFLKGECSIEVNDLISEDIFSESEINYINKGTYYVYFDTGTNRFIINTSSNLPSC